MIYNTILDAIGNTPLIKLNRMTDENSAQILVKFEGLNVGGSIKTRTAYNMILDAEKKGIINKDTIIVEPTSGNQGIGLALIGAVKGYKTIIIMPYLLNIGFMAVSINSGFENVSITKVGKLVEFDCGGEHFKLDLIRQRPPKKK